MGGFLSTHGDAGKQISGILAAEYGANHPNYLAIVNVDKAGAWDDLKFFMLDHGWQPAYVKAIHCKYFLKLSSENSIEFIEEIYEKLGKIHDELKKKYHSDIRMEYVVLKVCLPGATDDFNIPNMKGVFEKAA